MEEKFLQHISQPMKIYNAQYDWYVVVPSCAAHIFCTCLPACRQTFIKGNWGHSLNKLLKVLVTKAIECTKLHWSLFITRLLRDQGTHFKTLEVYFECVLKVHCCVADGFIASSSLVWLGQCYGLEKGLEVLLWCLLLCRLSSLSPAGIGRAVGGEHSGGTVTGLRGLCLQGAVMTNWPYKNI